MGQAKCFKECLICNTCWLSRKDFLSDADIQFIGYQAHFRALTAGLFFFNHHCKGTLAMPVSAFEDLYEGPIFQERMTGSDDCPGHCLKRTSMEPCPNACECAYVRELIQIFNSWPKATVHAAKNVES